MRKKYVDIKSGYTHLFGLQQQGQQVYLSCFWLNQHSVGGVANIIKIILSRGKLGLPPINKRENGQREFRMGWEEQSKTLAWDKPGNLFHM